MDKETYGKMYEAKWGGAPWLNDHRDSIANKGDGAIIIDTAPPPCPEAAPSITPTSSQSSSTTVSRRSTLNDE